jgi:predicted phage terminase large subunit-like protein
VKLSAQGLHGFSETVLASRYDNPKPTPPCHLEWWDLCCAPNPLVGIAAPRGHAKSTAISFAYLLAAVLFRERSFVLLVSATYEQSCLFLGDIKEALLENQDLIDLFGIETLVKETESDIICRFKDGGRFRIMAKGSEQSLRGVKWNHKRPDLIVCDDLESDEQVENKERRKKFRRWFFGALVPCKSDIGIVRVVGTILHMDSLLQRLMPKELDPDTITEPLKQYTKKKMPWLSVKYQAHDSDFSHILWKEQWPEKKLKETRQQFIEQGEPEVYSREYLNRPIDEEFAYFKPDDFIEMEDKDRNQHFKHYIGVDLAISESETADFSAFVVGAVDKDGMLYIVDVIRERLDGKEIVDCLFYLNNTYNPDLIVIEAGAIEKALGAFINTEMFEEGNSFLPLVKMTPVKDKAYRARSIQARMRAKRVKFDTKADWFVDLQTEMVQFPKSPHDDMVDAMAYIGLSLHKMTAAPTKREYEEALWEEEMAESEMYNEGRSLYTGY